jgi:hypothetical protein
MSQRQAIHPFALGAEAFEAGTPIGANPFRESDEDARAWAAGWMDARAWRAESTDSRKDVDLPDLASDPPPHPDDPHAPAPGPLRWVARALAFCAAWYAEARASRARAAASCAWAEADRWSAYAAVFRAVAERPTLRVLAEAVGAHLPPAKEPHT